jgi:chromosome partitioning protein
MTAKLGRVTVCGGTKGGIGKSTVVSQLAVLLAATGRDVLLVDADPEQASTTDFTLMRNESLKERGGAGYTAISLVGAAVRSEVMRLAPKYDEVLIDVGGRDSTAQRAALSIAQMYVVPFSPGSFDVWTLERVGKLVEEARIYNPSLRAACFLNKADAQGADNQEAAAIAREVPQLEYLEVSLGNRKAFRSSAALGLAVTEMRPQDKKAVAEIQELFRQLFDIEMKSVSSPSLAVGVERR